MGTVSFNSGAGLQGIRGLDPQASGEDASKVRLVHNPNSDSFATGERSSKGARWAGVVISTILGIIPGIVLALVFRSQAETIKQQNNDTVDAFLGRMKDAFKKSGGDADSSAFKSKLAQFRKEIGDGRSLTMEMAQKIHKEIGDLATQQRQDRTAPSPIPTQSPSIQKVETVAPPKPQDISWLDGEIENAVASFVRDQGIDPVALTPKNKSDLREKFYAAFEQLTTRGKDALRSDDIRSEHLRPALQAAVGKFAEEQQLAIQTGRFTKDLELGFQLEKRDVLDKSRPMDDRMGRSYHLLNCGRSAVTGGDPTLAPPKSSEVNGAQKKATATVGDKGFPKPLIDDGSDGEGTWNDKFLVGFDAHGKVVGGRDEPHDSYGTFSRIGSDLSDLHAIDGTLRKLEGFCAANGGTNEPELRDILQSEVTQHRKAADKTFDHIRDGLLRESDLLGVLDFKQLPSSLVEPLFLRQIPETAKTAKGGSLRDAVKELFCNGYQRPAYFKSGEAGSSASKSEKWDYGVGRWIVEKSDDCFEPLKKLGLNGLAGQVRGMALYAHEREVERLGMEKLTGALRSTKAGDAIPGEFDLGQGLALKGDYAVSRYCSESGDLLNRGLEHYQKFAQAYADYQKEGGDAVLTPKKSSALRRMQVALGEMEKATGQDGPLARLGQESPDPYVKSMAQNLVRLAAESRKLTETESSKMEEAEPLVPAQLSDVNSLRDTQGLLPSVGGKAVFVAATRDKFLVRSSGEQISGHEYLAGLKPGEPVATVAIRDIPGGRQSSNPSSPSTNDSDKLVVLGRGKPLSMENTGVSRKDWQTFENVQKARAEGREVSVEDGRIAESVTRALLPGLDKTHASGISIPLPDGSSLTSRLTSLVGKNQMTQSFAAKLANAIGEARWPREDKEKFAFLNDLLKIAESSRPALAAELFELYAPSNPGHTADPQSARQFAADAVKNPQRYALKRYELLTD